MHGHYLFFGPAVIAGGLHPNPSRTRKLSPPAMPRVLPSGGKGATPPATFYFFMSPGGVARPIIRDCHSRDSGSNPGQGAKILFQIIDMFYSFYFFKN